jgi:hypothetical protein
MADRYRVASRHPEDLASGASFAPGELAKGVNPKDPHDKRLIEEGRLVITTPRKSSSNKEESK